MTTTTTAPATAASATGPAFRVPRFGPAFRVPRFGPVFRIPRLGTAVAVTAALAVSLAPSLLPRTAPTQAVLSALLVLPALLVRAPRHRSPSACLLCAFFLAWAGKNAHSWQQGLRAAMGVPSIGPWYWVQWAALTDAIVVVGCGLAGVLARAGRRGAAIGLVVTLIGVLALIDSRQTSYAAADKSVDPALSRPATLSAAGWRDLGAQGRRFIAAPGRSVRVYVGVDAAPDAHTRAALAVRELEREGGFDRSHLVLAVPTGSGWIDEKATRGLQQRFGDDLTLAGIQYSYAPSWVTFVFGRQAAVESARALFDAVTARLDRMPPDRRPKLYVYGQSLGALGGSAMFADDAEQDRRTCATLWAGPPGGAVHRQGATVLANSSDPVVRWSPALLWRPPNLTGARIDAPVPRWLPVVSFVQASADLLGALSAPDGHGHRYGTDQGTAMGDCTLKSR